MLLFPFFGAVRPEVAAVSPYMRAEVSRPAASAAPAAHAAFTAPAFFTYGVPAGSAASVKPSPPDGSAGPAAPAARPPEHARLTLPAAGVLIDAGHGGIDGGAHWNDIMEKDVNLAIARRLYLILRGRGIVAALNRTGDYALSDENRWHRASRHRRDLSQRGALPHEIETLLLVSIHANWSPGGGGHGPIVLYQPEGRSVLLAECVQDSLNRLYGTRKRIRPGDAYYLLRKADIPSVIVEAGFLNDEGDRRLLASPAGQTRIASAIAEGIQLYLCIAG